MRKSGIEKTKSVSEPDTKPKRSWLKRVLVLLALLALVLPFLFFKAPPSSAVLREGKRTYYLEVADSSASREKGLSGRESLAGNRGMLFVFDEPGKYCFWMKDTLFPLDMIWLDREHRVKHIEKNVQPSSYPSQEFCYEGQAKYVIELNKGEVNRAGITINDKLDVGL